MTKRHVEASFQRSIALSNIPWYQEFMPREDEKMKAGEMEKRIDLAVVPGNLSASGLDLKNTMLLYRIIYLKVPR